MKQLIKKQINFLNNVCRGKWEQNDKGIVVYGDVNIYNKNLNKIPVRFYKVEGSFYCCCNNLISLEGCPEYVKKKFFCYPNNLISLEGCPEFVGGDFWCNNNILISLKVSPKFVGGDFFCDYNKLTSLEGIGELKGRIYCSGNKINYKKEKELRPEIYKKIKLSTLEKMLAES